MNKKNKIILIISVSIVLICGIIGGVILYLQKNSYKPEETLSNYYELLNSKDYEEMYNRITNESKSNISKEDFISRNKNIYEGIEAEEIEITVKNTLKNGDIYTLEYNTKMITSAGELSFDNKAEIKKEEGISWSSEMIYPTLTNEDKVRVKSNKAKRGSILDRNGKALAEDGIDANVGLVPGKLKDRDESLKKVSEILGVSVDYINKQLNASYVKDDTFVPLKEIGAKDERINQLLEVPGVLINNKKARVYPLGEQAAHLTGYVQNVTAEDLENNKDKGYTSSSVIGKTGIEKIYEDKLRGTDGVEIYIVDKNGNKKEDIITSELKNGTDVKLTIDSSLQTKIYNETLNDKSASVAMNPNTGEVLALVSTPSYNPNDFVMGLSTEKWDSLNNDSNKPLLNRFQNTIVPGSVFKPITAAIALENKTLDINENKNISGLKWQKDSSWGDYFVTRVSDYGSNTNFMNAMIYSDNIYFAQTALDVGKEAYEKKLLDLGFDEKIPFEYGLYSSSFGDDNKIDSDEQLADSGYGQGKILVNPVHLASIYSSFLNEGTMLTPYLDQSNNKTPWKENVISKGTADTILESLVAVVSNPNGTGHEANISGLTIAGKTGTAEIKASQDDTTGTEMGWFIGMTTNKGNNNIMVLTMVEDVKDRGGSHYVVPKVKNVISSYK
ncbi:MAG: penicillin-binding transpeptidase domain-containing protein [Clostridiales bacterium]|nr:penicillin-binding transpeptidase domain-containing protein [Clostridiales bacterium]